MRAFTYDALPGRVVFGVHAFGRTVDELERIGAQRVLLIADRSGRASADELRSKMADRLVGFIDDVLPHVPVERAEEARRQAREADVDVVVTLGGGSATGLGKAIALELPVRLLAIPTTYAGSEMTPIWGVTSGSRKETGRAARTQPAVVIYDPVLTLSLPPSIAGPSGMNALAHCAEALYADGACPISSLMAEEGARILARSLPRVVVAPHDLEARSDVLAGAYLAAASFAVAGTGIHHKICHVLGGAYDLPHAEMHTVVLAHALAFNAPAVPHALARLAGALGDPDVPGAVYELAHAIGAPTSLAAIGMAYEDLDEAADLIVAAAPTNPRPVTRPAIRALLQDAFDGNRPVAISNAEAGVADGHVSRLAR
ncbi:MAG TPA: maleylacetate reductase [Candidatus Limnocylindria bacterium]|nr:maleylacetate reductase [Candidatus Limnocylindria bacterium]